MTLLFVGLAVGVFDKQGNKTRMDVKTLLRGILNVEIKKSWEDRTYNID